MVLVAVQISQIVQRLCNIRVIAALAGHRQTMLIGLPRCRIPVQVLIEVCIGEIYFKAFGGGLYCLLVRFVGIRKFELQNE